MTTTLVHPRATLLAATLLTAKREEEQLAYPVHAVLEELHSDWREERRADLYARLAEGLPAGAKFIEAERIVSRCLRENHREFPNG